MEEEVIFRTEVTITNDDNDTNRFPDKHSKHSSKTSKSLLSSTA